MEATAEQRDLVLVGAGGFARETAEAVHAVNERRPTWRLLGFLDDSPERQDTLVDGLPVLGPIASLPITPARRSSCAPAARTTT